MLNVESVQNVTVVHFNWTALLDESEIKGVAQQLTRMVKMLEKPRILVDLSNAQRVSSGLVSVLVAVHQQAEAGGGYLALCGVMPEFAKVLRITGLEKRLRIYPSEVEAIQSLAPGETAAVR